MVSVVRCNGRRLNVMVLMCLKGVEVSEIRPYWNLVVVMFLVMSCDVVAVLDVMLIGHGKREYRKGFPHADQTKQETTDAFASSNGARIWMSGPCHERNTTCLTFLLLQDITTTKYPTSTVHPSDVAAL